ncbi:MAG: DUF1684 domain-containing protein [Candidatus Schekmanbacteria bacterium]|nr:DUF1684 domain-containing protein [Candidatus Schekmanbacteria bacterium]
MNNYAEQLARWRQQQEESLRSEKGWLSAVALTGIEPGEYTIGSSPACDIALPPGAPALLATLSHQPPVTAITFGAAGGVLLNGEAVAAGASYPLRIEKGAADREICWGPITVVVLQRANRLAVRVLDARSAARREHAGRRWYPADPTLVLAADWIPCELSRSIDVPDVLGNLRTAELPGYASFTLAGKRRHLYAIAQDDNLLFIFKDGTSGRETYGAGRFLYADWPRNAVVTLDFNRAVNPPCAFTPFAACPLPPVENHLDVAVRAGELKPDYG